MNEENDNQYFDDKEKCHKDVIKKYAIYYCPKYLIIQMKRWDYNLRKNQRIIHYDNEELDLHKKFWFVCLNNPSFAVGDKILPKEKKCKKFDNYSNYKVIDNIELKDFLIQKYEIYE